MSKSRPVFNENATFVFVFNYKMFQDAMFKRGILFVKSGI